IRSALACWTAARSIMSNRLAARRSRWRIHKPHRAVVAVPASASKVRPERTAILRIASFNINGVRARLPRLLEWLEERRPTVACLQEIKCQDDSFPVSEFEAIGYKAIWHGQKGF